MAKSRRQAAAARKARQSARKRPRKLARKPQPRLRAKSRPKAQGAPGPTLRRKVFSRPGPPRTAPSTPAAKTAVRPAVKARATAPAPQRPPKPPLFSKAELAERREALLAALKQLQANVQQGVKGASQRDLAHITDPADMASDAAEGDLAFRIAETEGVAAAEVQRAIDKIDGGTYGYCERCNKAIGAERLHFLPFATLCIRCQQLAEIRRKDEDLDELGEFVEATEEV